MRKALSIIFVLILAISFAACGAVEIKPWTNRTPVEKSLFFMDCYESQYSDTLNMAHRADLTDAQKEIVRAKKSLLMKVKPLLLSYDDYVKNGLTIPAGLEQRIIDFLNKLATTGG